MARGKKKSLVKLEPLGAPMLLSAFIKGSEVTTVWIPGCAVPTSGKGANPVGVEVGVEDSS